MQVVFNIDAEQILDIVSKMTIDDKLRLYDKIKDDIFKIKFEALLDKFKNCDLTEEEITKEVEHVREERYKNRH